MVIVSDKHAYAQKCQQEFKGNDKDIAHNDQVFVDYKLGGYRVVFGWHTANEE